MSTRWRGRFLWALVRTGRTATACRHAGVSRTTAYRYRNCDPEFAELWRKAEEAAARGLEAKSHVLTEPAGESEEAAEGLEGTARKLALGGNTQMLMFLLKARHPERYRDRPPRQSEPRAEGHDAREFVRRVLAGDESRRLAGALLAELARDGDPCRVGVGDECGTLVPGSAPAIVE